MHRVLSREAAPTARARTVEKENPPVNGLTVLGLIALVRVVTVAMVVREVASGRRDMSSRIDAFREVSRHPDARVDAYRVDEAPVASDERELVDA